MCAWPFMPQGGGFGCNSHVQEPVALLHVLVWISCLHLHDCCSLYLLLLSPFVHCALYLSSSGKLEPHLLLYLLGFVFSQLQWTPYQYWLLDSTTQPDLKGSCFVTVPCPRFSFCVCCHAGLQYAGYC